MHYTVHISLKKVQIFVSALFSVLEVCVNDRSQIENFLSYFISKYCHIFGIKTSHERYF